MTSTPSSRTLQHVIASPQASSKSRSIVNAYLEERRRLNPSLAIDELDLWATDLPEISGETLSAKYAVLARAAHTAPQQNAWDVVVARTQKFAAYDEYAFSVPMWNFGIPYKLKHYIDVVTQPGLTFTWSPARGYEGLLQNKRAFVAYASSFDYSSGTPLAPLDVQKQYFRTWLQLIGIADVVEVDGGPTSPAIASSAEAAARAHEEARSAAQR
jgi:FMN-dependent NADH-azoreductase